MQFFLCGVAGAFLSLSVGVNLSTILPEARLKTVGVRKWERHRKESTCKLDTSIFSCFRALPHEGGKV